MIAFGGSEDWIDSRCVLKAELTRYSNGLNMGYETEDSKKMLRFLARSLLERPEIVMRYDMTKFKSYLKSQNQIRLLKKLM